MYSVKGYEIPEANRTARGRAVVNIVRLDQGEKIQSVLPVKEGDDGYIVIATKKGVIKKTSTKEYERIPKNGKIAIKLPEGDEVISVQLTTGENELLIASRFGKCIRFSETDVRAMGRTATGVRAMKLAGDDELVDMLVVNPEMDIFTLTSNGYGKRTSVEDYRIQSRGGKGIKAGVFNEKTGWLVNMKLVSDDNDIMIITTGGTIIRMHADSISRIGRATRGVRVMNVKDSLVATVDVTERDDEAETAAPEETAADLSPEELAEGAETVEEEDDAPDTDDEPAEAEDEGNIEEETESDSPDEE